MKKTVRLLATLLCLTMVLGAVACGEATDNNSNAKVNWRTDVEVQTLVDAVMEKTDANDLEIVGDGVIVLETDIDLTVCQQYQVLMPSSSLDEFGVFRANDEAAATAVETALNAYITRRNEEWTGMYNVDEYPKLEDAKVQRYGMYVVYIILDASERTAAFAAVEQLLKG